uniref:Uncharacterized protein n=1 Tax=Anguilla anguilla TaxID=7936 RepID=A0A0E9SPE3_ANGAN
MHSMINPNILLLCCISKPNPSGFF